jgi:hypothetical protein
MTDSVDELTRQASFIFEGTIERTGATTTTAVQPAHDMVVVRVDKIVKGAPALSKYPGREITVQLLNPSDAHRGRRAMFFANSLHFGDDLAVREIGRSLDIKGAELEEQVHAAIRQEADNQLAHRLRDAEIVVLGDAVRTEPWQPPAGAKRKVSEHDPDWWECVIKIDEMLKSAGKAAGKAAKGHAEVVTLFAHSIDILWYQSPKFTEKSKGIWLLHAKGMRGEPVPGLVSIHPLDFHPRSERKRITELLEPRGT